MRGICITGAVETSRMAGDDSDHSGYAARLLVDLGARMVAVMEGAVVPSSNLSHRYSVRYA